MQRITPFIWFEQDLPGIIEYYKSIFPDMSVGGGTDLDDTPSGTAQMRSMTIYGQQIDIMVAGPYLPFRPTVSFTLICDSSDEAHDLWNKITAEGQALMPMQSYDFAPCYGWGTDKYGVSWQVLYMPDGPRSDKKIISTLMFTGDNCGRAEEAMNHYVNVFPNSSIVYTAPYESGDEVEDTRAKLKHAGFVLDGQPFSVLDSAKVSPLNFQQAISFVIYCKDQTEIDYYWDKLTDGGVEVQCGWLNDKFGLPWQVVPIRMTEMMSQGTPEQIQRVTAAFMQMKKFDIAALEEAFAG